MLDDMPTQSAKKSDNQFITNVSE